VTAPNDRQRRFVLVPLVGVYFFSTIVTLSDLGGSFPFMGKLYTGDTSESFIFVNCIISLYLIVGILKRQRLTLWLLIIYNFINSFNGISNLILLPVQQITTVSGAIVPDYHYRITSFWVFVLFLLLNVFLYFNRNHFDNRSIYLW